MDAGCLSIFRAPLVINGEPYNAKNRKDPKEKAAPSDINAGKRSSSLSLDHRANPPPLTPLNAILLLRREKKRTLEERIRLPCRCSVLSR